LNEFNHFWKRLLAGIGPTDAIVAEGKIGRTRDYGSPACPRRQGERSKNNCDFKQKKACRAFTESGGSISLTHMSAHHEAGEFVDSDFQSAHQSGYATTAPGAISGKLNRPPTREEIEAMVGEKQIRLAELKRAQEELERERAGLEELRRRQMEFQTGREEMMQHLTRGIGLLEESELTARRDAEQMARVLMEFREAVTKVQGINEQMWNQENFSVELTRATTTIENARMEWNAARLKFPILTAANANPTEPAGAKASASLLATTDLLQLCKIGLALTWPLVLLGFAIFVALLFRR
jgi:hypothetical protein